MFEGFRYFTKRVILVINNIYSLRYIEEVTKLAQSITKGLKNTKNY